MSPETPIPTSVCHLLIEVFVDDWLVLDVLSAAGKLHGRQRLDHAFQGRADHRHHRGLAVTSEAFFLGGGGRGRGKGIPFVVHPKQNWCPASVKHDIMLDTIACV